MDLYSDLIHSVSWKETISCFRKDRFFNVSFAGLTTSIIVEKEDFQLFEEDAVNVYGDLWSVIKIDSVPLGFEEYGIVKDFSVPLAQQDISIFYLSTFTNDYILIGEADIDKASEILAQRCESRMGTSL
jgi:hypothetical protein